jgi:hypothetical protein
LRIKIINPTLFSYYQTKVRTISDTVPKPVVAEPPKDMVKPTVKAEPSILITEPSKKAETLPPMPKPSPFPLETAVKKAKEIQAKAEEPPIEDPATNTVNDIAAVDVGKYALHLREQIDSGIFVGFIITMISYMYTLGMIVWWDIGNPGFLTVLFMVFWGFVILMGIKKSSLKEFALSLVKIIYNPRMEPEIQVQFIKEMIERLTGVALSIQSAIVNQTKIKIFRRK